MGVPSQKRLLAKSYFAIREPRELSQKSLNQIGLAHPLWPELASIGSVVEMQLR
jgi:hypothetical protein